MPQRLICLVRTIDAEPTITQCVYTHNFEIDCGIDQKWPYTIQGVAFNQVNMVSSTVSGNSCLMMCFHHFHIADFFMIDKCSHS